MNTFHDRLKKVRGDISQEDFASSVGINKTTYGRYERGIGEMSAKDLYALCDKYNVNLDWLMCGKVKNELVNSTKDYLFIPKVEARLSAGSGSLETSGEVEDFYAFQEKWVWSRGNPAHMVVMQVSGNSMEPEIYDSDLVLIDQSKKEICAGKIFAVGFGDVIYVKKVDILPKTIVLTSANKDYTPIYINLDETDADNVRIIGKVIWTCREYR